MNISDLNKKYLLTPKILYFLINLQFYALYQFRGLFAKQVFKVQNSTYGELMGILMFITFVTNIFIATLNDKFNKPKLFLITLLLTSSVFFQLFFINFYAHSFSFIFWFNMLMYLILCNAIPPLLDRITLQYLHHMNVGSKTYGRQRMWGTVGYVISNIITEKITKPTSTSDDITSEGKDSSKDRNFDTLRPYHIITTILSSLGTFFLFKSINTEGQRSTRDIESGWKDLLRNKAYMFFILIILLNGITRSAMTTYLTIYQSEILELKGYSIPEHWPGFIRTIINIFNENPLATSSFFGVILEITILYNSNYITTRFGLYWPLLFAQVSQFIRFFAYFCMSYKNPHAFAFSCSFELMKGLNFGFTHTSGVQLATIMCPPHLKSTSQMIYSGTFTGLSSIFAGLIFGQIFAKKKLQDKDVSMDYKVSTYQRFYFVNLIVSALSILLFVVKYGLRDRVLTWEPFRWRRETGDEAKRDVEAYVVEVNKKEHHNESTEALQNEITGKE